MKATRDSRERFLARVSAFKSNMYSGGSCDSNHRTNHGIVPASEPPIGIDHREIYPRFPIVVCNGLPEPIRQQHTGTVFTNRHLDAWGLLFDLFLYEVVGSIVR